MNIIRYKILGCLYGQAIGDALGLGTEFMCKSKIKNIYPDGYSRYDQIYQDSHHKRWIKGAWTDDTDMMLCILKAFNGQEFNIKKVAENFKNWFNGTPMGIGNNTFKVLCMSDYIEQPELCSKIMWDISRHKSAANGALMRTSVIGIPKIHTEQQAETISKLTHYDPRRIGSCVIVSLIIHNLIWNNKQLSVDEIKQIGNHYDQRIGEWIDAAYLCSDISSLELDKADSVGYTLRTLSAALWAYWHASSFEDGLLSVVNEGGDADTNAAVGCAILGAKFGYSSIPTYYIDNLQSKDMYKHTIEAFVSQIL